MISVGATWSTVCQIRIESLDKKPSVVAPVFIVLTKGLPMFTTINYQTSAQAL